LSFTIRNSIYFALYEFNQVLQLWIPIFCKFDQTSNNSFLNRKNFVKLLFIANKFLSLVNVVKKNIAQKLETRYSENACKKQYYLQNLCLYIIFVVTFCLSIRSILFIFVLIAFFVFIIFYLSFAQNISREIASISRTTIFLQVWLFFNTNCVNLAYCVFYT